MFICVHMCFIKQTLVFDGFQIAKRRCFMVCDALARRSCEKVMLALGIYEYQSEAGCLGCSFFLGVSLLMTI